MLQISIPDLPHCLAVYYCIICKDSRKVLEGGQAVRINHIVIDHIAVRIMGPAAIYITVIRAGQTVTCAAARSAAAGIRSENQVALSRINDQPFILIPAPGIVIIELDEISVDEIGLCLRIQVF